MESLVRFSDYDIFGYLASGLVALGIYDLGFGTHFVVGAEWSVTHGAFIVIAAYVLGHVVAAFATPIFDRFFVRTLLGRPSDILMRPHKPSPCFNWRKWVLSGYLEPLNEEVQRRVLERAGLKDAENDPYRGERIFWRAWPLIKRDPIPYARMDAFLRLYGFCRNFSFICLIGALAFLFRPPILPGLPPSRYLPAILMMAVSVVLFQRYLKFFRAYGSEVLTTYAEPE